MGDLLRVVWVHCESLWWNRKFMSAVTFLYVVGYLLGCACFDLCCKGDGCMAQFSLSIIEVAAADCWMVCNSCLVYLCVSVPMDLVYICLHLVIDCRMRILRIARGWTMRYIVVLYFFGFWWRGGLQYVGTGRDEQLVFSCASLPMGDGIRSRGCDPLHCVHPHKSFPFLSVAGPADCGDRLRGCDPLSVHPHKSSPYASNAVGDYDDETEAMAGALVYLHEGSCIAAWSQIEWRRQYRMVSRRVWQQLGYCHYGQLEWFFVVPACAMNCRRGGLINSIRTEIFKLWMDTVLSASWHSDDRRNRIPGIRIQQADAQLREEGKVTRRRRRVTNIFDSTLGYPGEGQAVIWMPMNMTCSAHYPRRRRLIWEYLTSLMRRWMSQDRLCRKILIGLGLLTNLMRRLMSQGRFCRSILIGKIFMAFETVTCQIFRTNRRHQGLTEKLKLEMRITRILRRQTSRRLQRFAKSVSRNVWRRRLDAPQISDTDVVLE